MSSVLEDPVPDPLQHPNYASPSPKRLASTVFGRTDSEALDEGDDEHSDHSKTREEGDKSPSIKLENKPTPECEDLDDPFKIKEAQDQLAIQYKVIISILSKARLSRSTAISNHLKQGERSELFSRIYQAQDEHHNKKMQFARNHYEYRMHMIRNQTVGELETIWTRFIDAKARLRESMIAQVNKDIARLNYEYSRSKLSKLSYAQPENTIAGSEIEDTGKKQHQQQNRSCQGFVQTMALIAKTLGPYPTLSSLDDRQIDYDLDILNSCNPRRITVQLPANYMHTQPANHDNEAHLGLIQLSQGVYEPPAPPASRPPSLEKRADPYFAHNSPAISNLLSPALPEQHKRSPPETLLAESVPPKRRRRWQHQHQHQQLQQQQHHYHHQASPKRYLHEEETLFLPDDGNEMLPRPILPPLGSRPAGTAAPVGMSQGPAVVFPKPVSEKPEWVPGMAPGPSPHVGFVPGLVPQMAREEFERRQQEDEMLRRQEYENRRFFHGYGNQPYPMASPIMNPNIPNTHVMNQHSILHTMSSPQQQQQQQQQLLPPPPPPTNSRLPPLTYPQGLGPPQGIQAHGIHSHQRYLPPLHQQHGLGPLPPHQYSSPPPVPPANPHHPKYVAAGHMLPPPPPPNQYTPQYPY